MSCSHFFDKIVLNVARPSSVRSRCRFFLLFISAHLQVDATHIFDGLDSFPTHVAHMRFGSFVIDPTPWPSPSTLGLYHMALQWLREDRKYRFELERKGRKIRGARRNEVSDADCLALLSAHPSG